MQSFSIFRVVNKHADQSLIRIRQSIRLAILSKNFQSEIVLANRFSNLTEQQTRFQTVTGKTIGVIVPKIIKQSFLRLSIQLVNIEKKLVE